MRWLLVMVALPCAGGRPTLRRNLDRFLGQLRGGVQNMDAENLVQPSFPGRANYPYSVAAPKRSAFRNDFDSRGRLPSGISARQAQGLGQGFGPQRALAGQSLDLFPELSVALRRDPVGPLPVAAIAQNRISRSAQLFKAPTQQDIPVTILTSRKRSMLARRNAECRRKFIEGAKAFASAYRTLGGTQIYQDMKRRLKSYEQQVCSRLPKTAVAKHKRSRGALMKASSAGQRQFVYLGRVLGLGQTRDFRSFWDAALKEKTGGRVADFGTHMLEDALGVCHRITNEELPILSCSQVIESLCESGRRLTLLAGSRRLRDAFEVAAESNRQGQSPKVRLERRRQPTSATENCRCLGQALRRTAKIPSGRSPAEAPYCVAAAQAAVKASLSPPRKLTLAEGFLFTQSSLRAATFRPLFSRANLRV